MGWNEVDDLVRIADSVNQRYMLLVFLSNMLKEIFDRFYLPGT